MFLDSEKLLRKLSYLSLLVFVASCFFSTTLMAISLIAASSFTFIDLIQNKEAISFKLSTALKYTLFSLIVFSLGKVLLAIYYSCNLGTSFDFKSLLSAYKELFHVFLIIFLAQNLKFKDKFWDFRRIIFLLIAGFSLLSSGYIVLQFILQSFGLISLEQGHFGLISQPYTNAGVILAGIFSSLYFYQKKSFKQIPSLIALIIQILALFLLGQVSSSLGFIVAFLAINFKQRIFSFRQLALIALATFLTLFFASQSVPRLARKLSWFKSFEKLSSSKSLQCRIALWQSNFENLENKFIFGDGKIKKYDCVIRNKTNRLSHSHNIHLHQIFTGGIFKFCLWLVFYLSLFFFLLRTYAENQVFLAFYIALGLEGFFEYWWGDIEVRSLFLILIFTALTSTKQDR